MLILRHLERVGRRFPAPVLTLGNFDGVHRGHQEILRRLVARARDIHGTRHRADLPSASGGGPGARPRAALLTDWRGRIERIAATGVGRHHRAALHARLLRDQRRGLRPPLPGRGAGCAHRRRRASRQLRPQSRGHGARRLRRFGTQYGFDVDIVGPVEVDGVVVSSSAVRHAISAGDLDRAARLPRACRRASRAASCTAITAASSLGFPTANLRIGGMVLPPDGVYAVRVRVGGSQHPGVANLGFNPTFSEHEHRLEAHLFDFDADLYGQRIEVSFVKRLRGETKFANVQALVEQIARDAAAARSALAESA